MTISIIFVMLMAFIFARGLSSYQEYDTGKYITANKFTSALFISKRGIIKWPHFGRKIPLENYKKWKMTGVICFCVLGVIAVVGVIFALIEPIYTETPMTVIFNPRAAEPVERALSLNESTVFLLALLLLLVEGVLSCLQTAKVPSEGKAYGAATRIIAFLISILLLVDCALVIFAMALEWSDFLF